MNKLILTSIIALGFSVGTASFAQDTTTQETTAPETTEEAPKAEDAKPTEPTTTVADETFPVAEETEQAKVGSEIIKSEHGDWKIICFVVPEGQDEQCRMYQLLTDDNDQPVAEFSIVALDDAAKAEAGVNFISPLGTLLTAQASMRVDAGQTKRYPYSWCEAQGCITRFGLTKAELDGLRKGNKAVMTILAAAAPKNPIELDLSLTGFTAGWNALKGI